MCNSPKPSISSTDRSKTWSESTISESSSVGASGAIRLSQQSSRLYSINVGKSNSVRKTLGARRALSTSQREVGSNRSESISKLLVGNLKLEMTVSISDVDIPASGEVTQSIGDDNDQGLKVDALPKTESLELSAPESIATEDKKEKEKEKEVEEEEEEKEEEEKEEEEKEQKKGGSKENSMSQESAEKEKEKETSEKKEKVIKKDVVKTTKKKETKPKSSSNTTPKSKSKSKPKPKPKPKLTHILSSTMLSEADRDVLISLVSSLGDAKFISRSSRSINLLVAGQDVRSVKMMCAVARGIPVVTPAWLYACLEQGKWVGPDSFISSFAEEGLKKRKEQEKGILANHGPYFIAKNTQPPRNELIEIVRCCDGQITEDLDECEYIIGKVEGREYVKETFVLDGVMKGELPRVSEYIVKEEEESDEFYSYLFTNNRSDRSC